MKTHEIQQGKKRQNVKKSEKVNISKSCIDAPVSKKKETKKQNKPHSFGAPSLI